MINSESEFGQRILDVAENYRLSLRDVRDFNLIEVDPGKHMYHSGQMKIVRSLSTIRENNSTNILFSMEGRDIRIPDYWDMVTTPQVFNAWVDIGSEPLDTNEARINFGVEIGHKGEFMGLSFEVDDEGLVPTVTQTKGMKYFAKADGEGEFALKKVTGSTFEGGLLEAPGTRFSMDYNIFGRVFTEEGKTIITYEDRTPSDVAPNLRYTFRFSPSQFNVSARGLKGKLTPPIFLDHDIQEIG